MTSTHGNKKSNRLVKPANDIITPNEYTLDMLPLTLFSVDILYSQISANNVFAGWCQHENFHMIQITSLNSSIWWGEVWSKISFEINVNKTFLHSPRKDVPFMLLPEIQDLNTRIMYVSDWDKVKLQFARNTVIGWYGSKALVTMDPYNSLKEDIYKDIVGSGGAFMLIINAWHEDHSENEETILGRSQKI